MKSFNEILNEKMKPKLAESNFTSENLSATPLDPVSLLWQSQQKTHTFKTAKNPYQPFHQNMIHKKAPHPKREPKNNIHNHLRLEPELRKSHIWTAELKLAFDGFNSLGGKLEIDFTKKELIKSYRHLALRWHPDHNNQNPVANDYFLKISTYKQILLKLFNTSHNK